MIRLLNSNFARLRMNSIFKSAIAASVFTGIICVAYGHRLLVVIEAPASYYSMDYHLFTFLYIIAFVAVAFCSYYVGIDYGDGTIRNKIAVGHSRTAIYLSNFVTNAVAACVLYSAYIVLAFSVGIPVIGKFRHFLRREIVILVLCAYALMISLAAMVTLVGMLVSNKVASLGISICGAAVALCIGLHQLNMLKEAAFWQDVMRVRREITLFLLDFFPGSQLMELLAIKYGLGNLNPHTMFGGSAFFAVLSTGIGLYMFQKKDIT